MKTSTYLLSSTELRLAALKMAKESCLIITEARALTDEIQKQAVIGAAVKQMDEATKLYARARRSELIEKK